MAHDRAILASRLMRRRCIGGMASLGGLPSAGAALAGCQYSNQSVGSVLSGDQNVQRSTSILATHSASLTTSPIIVTPATVAPAPQLNSFALISSFFL